VTFQARFAENLTWCRKRAGLTQEELAARAALGRDEHQAVAAEMARFA